MNWWALTYIFCTGISSAVMLYSAVAYYRAVKRLKDQTKGD
jgi:hypothetical protein